MGLQEIITLIASNGMAVVIIAYFLYKDYKFNGSITAILSEIKEVLAVIKDNHRKD